ncbi:hypothetical protein Tco_0814266 [Tanacetum coccineum]
MTSLIYSKTKEEHDAYLRLILELLKKEELLCRCSQSATFGCRRHSVDAEGESHSYASRQLKIHEKNYTKNMIRLGACGVRTQMWETIPLRHEAFVFTEIIRVLLQHMLD